MERRLTTFLLPLLVVVFAFMMMNRTNTDSPAPGQGSSATTQPAQTSRSSRASSAPERPIDEYRVWKAFGTKDQPGSFWISFDKRGAAIRQVCLLDHYVDVAAKKRETKTPDDYYMLAQPPAGDGYWGLVLEPQGSAKETFHAVPIDGDRNAEGESQVWEMHDEPEAVRFSLDCKNGYVLEKTFRHAGNRRDLEVEITLRNVGHQTEDVQLRLRGLALSAPESEQMIGASPASAFALRTEGGVPLDSGHMLYGGTVKPREELASNTAGSAIAFAGTMNRFFAALLKPADVDTQRALYAVAAEHRPAAGQAKSVAAIPVPAYELRLRSDRNAAQTLRFLLYLGPKSYDVWNEHPEYDQFHYALDADLAPVGCFCNIPGSATVAKFLLKVLSWLERVFGSWPLAIVLLTLLVRLCIVPLNFRMQKSMRAYGLRMGKVKPMLDALQKEHADDPKALQAAMVAFNKQHKLFPPLGGCLPLLITMPIFLGMFTTMRAAYGLRQAPLALWIQDLSRPDAIMHLGWGLVPDLNVLPFVMVGMWWIMQSSAPAPTDPQQKQMYTMMKIMPFVMGVTLYSYAAGLMLYMITSSTFQIIESRITKKILGPIDPNAAAIPTAPQF
jgi:YidC/Oxa1 family membrane protein insertase